MAREGVTTARMKSVVLADGGKRKCWESTWRACGTSVPSSDGKGNEYRSDREKKFVEVRLWGGKISRSG